MPSHSRLVKAPSAEPPHAQLPILQARNIASQLQTKLRVGGESSPAEQQADAFAQNLDNSNPMQLSPVVSSGGFLLPSHFPARIFRASRNGQPVPSGLQKKLGAKLGADLRNVKLHSGPESAQLNHELGARAFTVGTNIHFASRAYNPASASGQQLLAHELTHTVQQSQSGAPMVQCSEDRALALARRVMPVLEDEPGLDWQMVKEFFAIELEQKGFFKPLLEIEKEDDWRDAIPLEPNNPLAPFDNVPKPPPRGDADADVAAQKRAQSGLSVGIPVLQRANTPPPQQRQQISNKRTLKKMKKDPALAKAVDAFSPSYATRIKRGLRKPGNWANLIPFVAMLRAGRKVWHEWRKGKGMSTAASGAKTDVVAAAFATTGKRAVAKRNIGALQTVLSGATSAASLATGGVGNLLSPLLEPMVGAAAAGGIAWGGASAGSAGAKSVLRIATSELSRLLGRKSHPFAKENTIKGKNTAGGALKNYKVNRALLYHLGRGAMGGAPEKAEAARQAMRTWFGMWENEDLTQREAQTVKRDWMSERNDWRYGHLPFMKKQDWLLPEERNFYNMLKKGEITLDKIPQQYLMPILWQANKIFDYHDQYLKQP